MQTVPVGVPGGGTVDIHFWGTPRVLPERIPGILDFELFPPADAELLVEVAERWSQHDQGWSEKPDSVDKLPEWQINLLDFPPLDEDTQVDESMPNVGLKTALLPLTKRICIGMLTDFLAKHRVATDRCSSVFMRKYDATFRPNIPTHQDSSVFTLNVALSDHRKVQGGELFACKQVPQSWAMILKAAAFSFVYPYSRIAMSTPEDPGTCMKAQGAQGHAVSAFGSRLHGVFPTEGGTRYSLILFIGETRKFQLSDDDQIFKKNSYLAEPFVEDHVTNLSGSDMMSWLIFLSGISTRVGRGEAGFPGRNSMFFQNLLHDGASVVYTICDLALVLKHFANNAEFSSLALRSMHAMLVGLGMPRDKFRRVAVEAGAEEHVLRAVASHPDRIDVGRLGCAVWQALRCGGLEGEECKGRPAECEVPELWGPLEIDEALHGTKIIVEEEWDNLQQSCAEQTPSLHEQGLPVEPDCLLLFVIFEVKRTRRSRPKGTGGGGREGEL